MSCSTGSREDAIRALISVWLKDKRLSCGWCGTLFNETNKVVSVGIDGQLMEGFKPCCEQPYITNNYEILRQFNKEMQERREQQKNKFASNADSTLRLTISMPPSLLLFLEKSFERLYQEELFTKEHNHNWFAKKFGKTFAVAEEI